MLFLCVNITLIAQNKKNEKEVDNSDTEQRLENLSEQTIADNLDYSTLLDNLVYYTNHPINLNSTNYEELLALGLLDDIQIANLLSHIQKNGKLIRLEELQTIDGFDLQTIKKIFPYIFVSDKLNQSNVNLKELLTQGKHAIIVRTQTILETEKGLLPASDSLLALNKNARYLGDRFKHFVRYRYTFGTNISWGITAEKDVGEEFFKGTQKQGFDFYSAHLAIRNLGKIKSLNIGDYQVQFGQGLTFSTGLAYGKTADIMAVKRNYVGSRAYTSVNENIFLRGFATNISLSKNIHVTTFVSSKKIDAYVVKDTLTTGIIEDVEIAALQISGFHRTFNELKGRKTITENVLGGNITYQTRAVKIAVTHAFVNYTSPIVKQNKVYNIFNLQGNNFYNTGLDFNKVWRNFNFFGEVARSKENAFAFLAGAIFTLDPRVSASIIYRNYEKNYQAPFSNAFAENTRNTNEKGIYFGLNIKTTNAANVALYYDQFKYDWLKFGVSAPSNGNDLFIQYNYVPTKKVNMYARFRQRNKFKNTKMDIDDIDFLVNATQQNFRFEMAYSISKSVRMKNRIEFVKYKQGANEENSLGYLAYHDISYKALSSPISFSFRYAIFNAPTFNTRLYSFENDLFAAFSIPSFYGRGIRTYGVIRYNALKNLDIWLRLSSTIYTDRQIISSGLSQIQSNRKSEIKLQARYTF